MPDASLTQTFDDVTLVATALGPVNLSLDQTCDEITLVATALGPRNLVVDQTLETALLVSTVLKGRVLATDQWTAEATIAATIELGERPEGPVFPARGKIYNLTGEVRQTGGAILCFVGPPWKTIEWRVLEGHGTLTPFTTFTDKLGRCSCRFDAAGFTETVVIGAAYVP